MPEEMTTELAECSRRRGRSRPDPGEGGGAFCGVGAAGVPTEAKEGVLGQGRGAWLPGRGRLRPGVGRGEQDQRAWLP